MKATPSDYSQSSNKKNVLRVIKSEPRQIPYFNPENFPNDEQKKNLLNMPLKNAFENGGRNQFFPEKRNYRDIFMPEINRFPPINNNISNTNNINRNIRNRTSTNSSFYKEPGLINKIRRNENMVDNTNINNNINNNNIINNNITNISQNMNNNFIRNEVVNINKNDEEEKNTEILEDNKEKEKKMIDEYNILEKILKEEQNLFLDDNYHILQSEQYERIPEELSSYIISKRVNFPNEIYQTFSSEDNSNQESEFQIRNEEKNSENFAVIFPPLNSIIFVQRNILTFFNFINEKSFSYDDFSKPVKKLLITIPKPGILINDEIKFIMVCVLEGEIHILGIAFENNEYNVNDKPIIHKTDFIINFKETVIDLISTANHRIFMSVSNNKIYELNYSIRQNNFFNFFGPKSTLEVINKEKPILFGIITDLKFFIKQSREIIYKLKVDNTRNILYALKYTIPNKETTLDLNKVIDSSVVIFDLGLDGNGFSKLTEIWQEDILNFGYDFYGYNNFAGVYSESDLIDNNNLIQRSNIIIDIVPLTRDKYKDYHLLIIKRNGHKIFLNFMTYTDETNIKNEDKILQFNSSAFCRNRITERFTYTIKQIPISKYNNLNNNNNQTILYDIINYFPFSTFCFYKNKNINDTNIEEYILNIIDDDFSSIARNENIHLYNQNRGLAETEETLYKSTTDKKELYSIIKLSDYNIEDSYGLGNLLKNSNNIFISKNTKYIDNSLTEIVSYNYMNEYVKQLFYSPEEYAILFSDEFLIFKKLRPIDALIEIMQYKNFKNNIINDKDNISSLNDIDNNSANDLNINLNSNESSSHMRKRISMPSLIGQKNRISNPFQINRDKIISQKFKEFISIHGYIETTVMLLNIITNNNFNYYIKNPVDNLEANQINQINNIRNNIIHSNNNSNKDDFLNFDDLQKFYLTPYSLTQLKNDNQLMKMGQEFLMKLFIYAKEDIDIQSNNYQNLLNILLNNLNINKELLSQNNNNNNLRFRINTNNNINNNLLQNMNNLFEGKNFMSYGFLLFLSRIVRLFWEENIFIRTKIFYQSDNFDFNIINNLNQNQIMFIKNMLIKFLNTINQYKIDLLQHTSNITINMNKFNNYLNDIDQFLKNNSGYAINEVKRQLSPEDQNIINNHKRILNYYNSTFNFQKFNNDLDIIISITNRIIEILNFMDTIYKINITPELKRRKSYNILDIKIKDLFKGNYPFVISELLQIIFEFYLKEKNMEFASIKIQEIIQQCPNIVNKSDANAIEGNFLLKFCNYNELDNLDKIKYIQEAVEKINLNLKSVKIEEVVNYLSKFQDIKNIITFCLKKGKLLESDANLNIEKNPDKLLHLNKTISLFGNDIDDNDDNDNKFKYNYNYTYKDDTEENKKDINKLEMENNDTEFYKCINIILNILHYLHNSIVYNSFEHYINVISPNSNIFYYPVYINNLLSNRTMNEYLEMENFILNLIFNEQYEYIHYIIISFLKKNNMINKLQEINSPSIEKYLNNEINLNNNSPQSLFSMYNFYFRNKNYSCATKILANLINYKNTGISLDINGDNINKNKNFVSLDDRITYVNSMFRTIELQIKDAEYIQLPEQKMKEIQEAKLLKEKMINIRNLLNIQYEIKSYLTNYINNALNNNNWENEDNDRDLNEFEFAIIKLDNEIISLNELYQNFAKKFSIFDSCISILFEIKFSNTNNKIERKEIRSVYTDYFCKFDERTLESSWPYINFDRFTRLFNTLIKEKTQYQNFYNMLQTNGMKNKYRDIIPLEFIIALIERMNRRLIFSKDNFFNNDKYYLIKLKQNYTDRDNPFWFIHFLREQIFLPFSFIFNEYFIIYLSLCKESNPKKFSNINNYNDFISNKSNIINNDNLSVNTFNSNNLSVINDSGYEEYGMIFDGNLTGDINKKLSQDTKLYSIFLLLGIAKLWIDRLIGIIDNNIDFYLENKTKTQDNLDLKQFYLEIKKNGNLKINNIIKEYFEELKNCKLHFDERKYEYLKKYGEIIKNDIEMAKEKVNNYYLNKNKINDDYDYDEDKKNYNNSNDNKDNILKIKFVGDRNTSTFMPFTNSMGGGGFINKMGPNKNIFDK